MKTLKAVTTIWIGTLLLAMPVKTWALSVTAPPTGPEPTVAEEPAVEPVATVPVATPAAPAAAQAAPAAATPAKSLTSYCRNRGSELDTALGCAEKLQQIAEDRDAAYEKDDSKSGDRLDLFLRNAKRLIKSNVSTAFTKVIDSASLETVIASANAIALAAIGSSDDFHTEIEKLITDLTGLARQKIAAAKEAAAIEKGYAEAYDRELRNYKAALRSGIKFDIDQAEKGLKALQLNGVLDMDELEKFDPTRTVGLLKSVYADDQTVVDNLDSFMTQNSDLRAALQNDMSGFMNKADKMRSLFATTTDNSGTSTTQPHAGEPRQRRASFDMIYQMPGYGTAADLFGNSALTGSSSRSIFDDTLVTSGGRVTRGH